jgi:hypothetical protein
MITAEVIKGVNELLGQSGVKLNPDERFGDYVARRLGISARQAEVLLEELHDGATVEEAMAAAEVEEHSADSALLKQIARTIGSTLGRISAGI